MAPAAGLHVEVAQEARHGEVLPGRRDHVGAPAVVDVALHVTPEGVDDGLAGGGVDGEDLAADSVGVGVVELEVRALVCGEAQRGDALVLRQRGGGVVGVREAGALRRAADHVHPRSGVAQLGHAEEGVAVVVRGDVEDCRRRATAVRRARAVEAGWRVDTAGGVDHGLALRSQVRQELGADLLVHQLKQAVRRHLGLVGAQEVSGPLRHLRAGVAVAVEDGVGAGARRLVGDEGAVLLVARVAVVGRGCGLDGHLALGAPDAGQVRVSAHLGQVVSEGARGRGGAGVGGQAGVLRGANSGDAVGVDGVVVQGGGGTGVGGQAGVLRGANMCMAVGAHGVVVREGGGGAGGGGAIDCERAASVDGDVHARRKRVGNHGMSRGGSHFLPVKVNITTMLTPIDPAWMATCHAGEGSIALRQGVRW